MKKLPDMIFVIDVAKEHIAVEEANYLGIKVIAPLDTNCDPDKVTYPIPGNDDAIRSIQLFCKEIAEAIIEGRASNKDNIEENTNEETKEENTTEKSGDSNQLVESKDA